MTTWQILLLCAAWGGVCCALAAYFEIKWRRVTNENAALLNTNRVLRQQLVGHDKKHEIEVTVAADTTLFDAALTRMRGSLTEFHEQSRVQSEEVGRNIDSLVSKLGAINRIAAAHAASVALAKVKPAPRRRK